MSDIERIALGICPVCTREAVDVGELPEPTMVCSLTLMCADHVRFAADSFAVAKRAERLREKKNNGKDDSGSL